MTFKILEHRTLYSSDRYFSAFPGVVTLPSGDVLLGFRRAPDHRWLYAERRDEDFNAVDHVHFRSHIALCRFNGQMELMGDAEAMPVHGEAGDQDANLFVHSSGRLIQYGFLWYPITIETAERLKSEGRNVLMSEHYGAGYLFWGGYARFSDDEGRTWSAYNELPINEGGDVAGGPYRKGVVAVRGRMIERDDGILVFAGYSDNSENNGYQQTCLFASHDRGESWSLDSQKLWLKDIGLQEPALANWPKGSVTAFRRTKDNEDKLVIATAHDGHEFSKPETLNVVGHPYDPLVLPDGRLLLVYGYRHSPMGVRARLVSSIDELEGAEEIIIRDDSPGRDTGYPSATILSDGRIIIAYYMVNNDGIRGIEATFLQID